MGISDYLAGLRRHVGHDMLFVPAVAVLVWREHRELLLVRARDSGMWQTIGGALDPEEDPVDGARREAAEEAGIAVELTGIAGVFGGPEFTINYPNGDVVNYSSTVFDARIAHGTPRPDGDETTEVRWIPVGELAGENLTAFTVHLLARLGLAGADLRGEPSS